MCNNLSYVIISIQHDNNINQNFNSKQLSESESQCVTKCSEKFMKLTQRVGFRFTEYQAIRNNQGDQGKQSDNISRYSFIDINNEG